jgi:nitroimidazol reductase NimA-like FMN-containing flavoprotein (pyridoxamine 5'-phosphate oxidase superfamily)
MLNIRRKEKEITEKEVIEEIFRQNTVGRLGTAIDGQPNIIPMNFVYTNDKIFLHSHKDGKKIDDIQNNPRVCFEVDQGEIIVGDNPCSFSWRYKSAIAYGKVKIIEPPDLRIKALKLLSDKYSFGKGKLITPELMKQFNHLLLLEIGIEKMVGKKSPA